MIPSNRVKSSITLMPTVYSLSACTSAAFDNGGDDDKHCDDDDDDEVGDGVVVGVGRNNDNDNDARLMTTTGSSSSSSSSTPTPTPTPRNPKLRHQVSSCRSVVLSDPAVSSSPSLPHYNQHQQHQRTVLSSSSIPDARVNLVHPHSFHLWHLHVFSLPHNAIRAELIDLCAMLHSLLSHPSPPLHLLREWYPYFHGFLSTYLTLEQTVLLPWVYLGVEDARILAFRDAMAPDHVLIGQLLDELTNVLTLTKSRPTSFTLPLLLRAVRDLVNPLLVYLDREERVLPNLIQARNCRVEAGNVERVMAKSLDVGLLLRWVPSRSQRVKLRMKFLSVPDLVSGFCQSRVKTARHLAIVRSIVRHPQ